MGTSFMQAVGINLTNSCPSFSSPLVAVLLKLSTAFIKEFITGWGYITIGFDHTYDSMPVQFPDGEIIFDSPIPEENTTLAAIVRTQDVISIAQHITSTNALAQWIC